MHCPCIYGILQCHDIHSTAQVRLQTMPALSCARRQGPFPGLGPTPRRTGRRALPISGCTRPCKFSTQLNALVPCSGRAGAQAGGHGVLAAGLTWLAQAWQAPAGQAAALPADVAPLDATPLGPLPHSEVWGGTIYVLIIGVYCFWRWRTWVAAAALFRESREAARARRARVQPGRAPAVPAKDPSPFAAAA